MLIFPRVFKKLSIRLTSLQKYVKAAKFVMSYFGSVCMFVFVVVDVASRIDFCYIHYFIVCFNGVYFCLFCSFGYWISV